MLTCDSVQVTTLQQQIVSLKQSHAVQDKELSRIRAETLSLAAKTAASAAAPRRSGTSSSGGGSGVSAGQQQALQQQLAAAEEHNQVLLLQVGKLQEGNSLLQRQLGEFDLDGAVRS